jgi:hypothetical protein
MRRKAAVRSATTLTVLSLFWFAGPARGANLYAVPSVAFEQTFDTNVFNTPDNEESDFILRVKPRLTLSLDAFHTRIDLSGGFEMERYRENTGLNSTAATKNAALAAAEPLRLTPRFSLRPAARFVETDDTARRRVLAESPVTGLPPEEAFVTPRTRLREWAGALEAAYRLTPLVELGLAGAGLRREYPDDPPGLFDSTTWTGSASAAWRVSPRFSPGLFFDASYNAFDERPDSRIFSGGLSAGCRLTTRHSLDVRAGASYLRDAAGDGGGGSRDEWSPYGRLSLSYASGGFRASLSGSYELVGGGSFGRTAKRGTAALALSDRITPRWSWRLSGFVQTGRSTDEAVTEDLVSASGTLGLRYAATRWAALALSGGASRQWSKGLAGDDIERYTVALALTLFDNYKLF